MLGPPARRVSTPVELLMESIRQHDHKGLRPTKSLMVEKTGMLSVILNFLLFFLFVYCIDFFSQFCLAKLEEKMLNAIDLNFSRTKTHARTRTL